MLPFGIQMYVDRERQFFDLWLADSNFFGEPIDKRSVVKLDYMGEIVHFTGFFEARRNH
jgi:hypothetical protein